MTKSERPLRILRLRTVDGEGGGPEKTILASIEAQDRSRIHTTLVYLRPPGEFWLAERARQSGLDYLEIPDERALDWRAWRRLAALTREQTFDLIHSHDYKTDVFTYWFGRRHRLPTLSVVHSFDGHIDPGWRREALYLALRRRLLPTFDRVLAVSRGLEQRLLKLGVPQHKLRVLTNGIDSQRFRPRPEARQQIRSELGLEPEHEVVGTIGRLVSQKRLDRLLTAVAALAPRRPRLRCVLVGDGALRDHLQRQAADAGLAQICTFLGHRQDVHRLPSALDVFVSTSDWEGSPNAILEAMACERPIVATAVDGNQELIDDQIHGLLVNPENSSDLAHAIDRLLDDRGEAHRLAAAARAKILHHHSAAVKHQELEAIYQELIPGSRAGSDQSPRAAQSQPE